jgi:hypothetical protein
MYWPGQYNTNNKVQIYQWDFKKLFFLVFYSFSFFFEIAARCGTNLGMNRA